jgi:hypothetical protein
VLVELQLGCLLSCNFSDKNYIDYTLGVATEVLEKLQLKRFYHVATGALFELQFV